MSSTTEVRDLSVTLTMTPEIAQTLARESGALTVAEAFIVDSDEMAGVTNDELKQIKAKREHIKAMKDRFIQPAQQIIDTAKEFFNPPLEALDKAEALLKSRLMTYQTEQRRIAEEARLKAEAEERQRRQKAEQEAAAARAAAEERARQERQKAEEAERARQEAEAAGNATAARAAAETAARATERAQAALENGEAKAQATTMAAAAVAPSVVAPAPAKLAGFSMRDNWTAKMTTQTETEAVMLIAAALPQRPDFAAYLKIDTQALNKLAKAQKSLMAVPGFEAINTPIAASRAA